MVRTEYVGKATVCPRAHVTHWPSVRFTCTAGRGIACRSTRASSPAGQDRRILDSSPFFPKDVEGSGV